MIKCNFATITILRQDGCTIIILRQDGGTITILRQDGGTITISIVVGPIAFLSNRFKDVYI